MKNLRTLNASLASWLLLFIPAIAQAEDPRLSVRILNPIAGAQVPQGVNAVSNVRRIELEVTLEKLSNSSLKALSDTPVNPNPGNLPTNYFIVRATERSTGAALAVKTAVFGNGMKDGAELIKLTLEIPEDAAVRASKIQSFIDQTKARDLASGAATQAQIDKLTAQNAIAVAAFEKRYMENRLGQFNIVVEYHSTQQGAWNGQIANAPVVVEVQNKGSYFDGF
jgi:hypothetical protein